MKKVVGPSCRWQEDDEGNWDTDCGDKHVLNDGTPRDNHMIYCCYCGRALNQKRYKEPR